MTDVSVYQRIQLHTSLKPFDIQTVKNSSKTIRNIIYNKNKNRIKFKVGVYTVPCRDCDKNHIGEISRSIQKPIYEQVRDFRIGDNRKAFVKRYLETKK